MFHHFFRSLVSFHAGALPRVASGQAAAAVAGALLITAGASATPPPPSSPPVIILDGAFDDWAEVPVALTDPADAPDAEIDFRVIKVASDDTFLHFYVELGRTVNLQGLDGRMRLLIDADADPATGATMHEMPGVDVMLEFSPRNERRPEQAGRGAAIEVFGRDRTDPRPRTRLSGYDGGLAFAPTYASDRVEIRLERALAVPGRPGAFRNEIAFRLIALGPDGAVTDETDVIRHRLGGPVAFTGGFGDRDPITRAEGTQLRIASWNSQDGAILSDRERSLRMLRAVNPDIVLLQELQPADDLEAVRALFNELGGTWTVVMGEGGGNMHRCGVATRLPVTETPAAARIDFPGRRNWLVRTSAIGVESEGRRLLLLSMHLKCCGRLGDESDQRRETEATAINQAVREALRSGDFHGAIIGGDVNLVGGIAPLHILKRGADGGRGDLVVLNPMQPCGRTNVTWYDPGNPFTPGRLDFIFATPTTIEPLQSFVFNTRPMDEDVLRRHDLQPDDAVRTSDHFPIIADFRWRSPRRAGAAAER